MDGHNVLVSVIIPAFNAEAFLADAVASVLAQPCARVEVLIIDDGSTDGTARLAAGFPDPVRHVRQAHRGLPAARNHGVRIARGEVLAFLDADDLWSRDKLGLQLALLRSAPDAGIVIGHTQLMRLVGRERGTARFVEWGAPVLALSMGSAVFRTAVFGRVGLFDETQAYCDDLDWFMRAAEQDVPRLVHSEVTLYYRRHDHNMTNQADLGRQYLLGMLKKSLIRRGYV
jgi:glycosyltransferase involved in cell wall biosynthesis